MSLEELFKLKSELSEIYREEKKRSLAAISESDRAIFDAELSDILKEQEST